MKRAELEAEIRRLEERLLDPAVRADPEAVGALLDPEFTEIGQYGRVWTRAAILAALAADPGLTGASTIEDFTVRRVAPDVVLVTYTLHNVRVEGMPPAAAIATIQASSVSVPGAPNSSREPQNRQRAKA